MQDNGFSFYGLKFANQDTLVNKSIHAKKMKSVTPGHWRTICGQPKIDTQNGMYATPEEAMYYDTTPRYKICNATQSNIPDDFKLRHWDENPPAGVKLPYDCNKQYAQEGCSSK